MKAPLRTQPGRLEAGRKNKREAAVLGKFAKQIQIVEYDFDIDGGTQGDIDFSVKLPENSIITSVYYDVLTDTDSAGDGEDFKLKAGSTDLMDADTQPGSTGPVEAGLAAGYPLKLSASEELKMEIGGEDMTAGNLRFFVEFMISE